MKKTVSRCPSELEMKIYYDLLPFDIGADFGEAAVGVQDEAFSVWQGNVGLQRRTRTGPKNAVFVLVTQVTTKHH